ncbi:type II toxin-antitoxin system HicB family antitoxin [Cyanothece sp. BG0011]|uniref:type II toxin-antitoxin system HicB family antitoxin n=1 Tax=Cyanothece sp. BG0011 TaxID=2082950 RepID=UPI000D1EDCC9|nr:type II toxin-antitoxin system HicB family antitoxin [Cyanothece sp. BG0011]
MIVNKDNKERTVFLYPDEDGYVIAEVPSLPGCISQGETRQEALDNIKEAIALHLEVLEERGELIPEDNIEITSVMV